MHFNSQVCILCGTYIFTYFLNLNIKARITIYKKHKLKKE